MRYSSFLYQKYDESLNIIYENSILYNDAETSTHIVFISPIPYFNSDSSKIWFDTYISLSDLQLYYGMIIGVNSKSFTFANIIDQQNGNLIKQVDLNELQSNFLGSNMNDIFYYLSTNLSQDSFPNSTINAYNFDRTLIHNKTWDSSFFINNNPGGLGIIFNQSVYNNQVFCNITNTFALQCNTIDSLYNTKTGFLVFDTFCNLIMNTSTTNDYIFTQHNLFSKLHVIDKTITAILVQ